MNPRIIALMILLGTLVLGFARLLTAHRQVKRKIAFASEYTNTFMQFAQADETNAALYTWLVRNSVKMQHEIGIYGIVDYKPPGSFKFIPNYQIILNLLPEIFESRRERFGPFSSRYKDKVLHFWETLTRYSGILEEQFEESKKRVRNPFIWLQTGVQTIVLVPLFILNWLGLLGQSALSRVQNLGVVNIVSGLIALAELVSAIVTIAIGWDEFQKLIINLWQTLF